MICDDHKLLRVHINRYITDVVIGHGGYWQFYHLVCNSVVFWDITISNLCLHTLLSEIFVTNSSCYCKCSTLYFLCNSFSHLIAVVIVDSCSSEICSFTGDHR